MNYTVHLTNGETFDCAWYRINPAHGAFYYCNEIPPETVSDKDIILAYYPIAKIDHVSVNEGAKVPKPLFEIATKDN